MDPNNSGPQEYGSFEASRAPDVARVTRLVVGDYLLTVNPVDGSEVQLCPPSEQPPSPRRRTARERATLNRSVIRPGHVGRLTSPPPLVEREEERRRISELLERGRSVRVVGRPGTGRSALLDAAASDAAEFAPDGVVRLSGYHRTPTDLLHELFATVFDASALRLERTQLYEAVARIGAVVVLDDVEFGGEVLDDLLDATPECAFLLAADPEQPPPSARCRVEEITLSGISRTGCLELLEHLAHRSLTDEETDWAADLWFESEGLPLRFVQAGALLRQRDALWAAPDPDDRGVFTGDDGVPALPSVAGGVAPVTLLASWLPESARAALRLALALDGELPDEAHLSLLTSAPGDPPSADSPLEELLSRGLLAVVGHRYRLADGVDAQLSAAGYQDGAAERAEQAAQHYAWWCGHPAVVPQEVAAEAAPLLSAMRGAQRGGSPTTAVLLARAAAPMFAAALHWNAWEMALRVGQEAARQAGEVAEEAYLHHELGVLALCTGNLGRARTELEASVALHGVLADGGGVVAGRRVLALVEDRSTPLGGRGPDSTDTLRSPAAERGTPVAGTPAALLPGPGGDPAPGSGAPAEEPTTVLRRPGRSRPRRGARRNLLAAGAGTLLVAVFGTVVALTGVSDGDGTDPADRVEPDRPSAQPDHLGAGGLDAQPATPSSDGPSRTSPSGDPSGSDTPSTSPSTPSRSAPPGSPSGDSASPGSPSADESPGEGSGGVVGGTSGEGGDGGASGGDSGSDGGGASNGGGADSGTPGDSEGSEGGTSEGDEGGTSEGEDGGASEGGGPEGGEGGTSEGGSTEGGTGSPPSDSSSADPSRSASGPPASSPGSSSSASGPSAS